MIGAGLILGLVGLSSASPMNSRDVSMSPLTSSSQGFRLVVDMNPSDNFKPEIQNNYVASFHIGAGLNLATTVPRSNIKDSLVFYQNGTQADQAAHQTTVLNDEGIPLAPYGWTVDPFAIATQSNVHINAGEGSTGVYLTNSDRYVQLGPQKYLACNTSVSYYEGSYFTLINSAGQGDVPNNCVSILLLPECAALQPLPKDAITSHQYALDSPCYPDVLSIN